MKSYMDEQTERLLFQVAALLRFIVDGLGDPEANKREAAELLEKIGKALAS